MKYYGTELNKSRYRDLDVGGGIDARAWERERSKGGAPASRVSTKANRSRAAIKTGDDRHSWPNGFLDFGGVRPAGANETSFRGASKKLTRNSRIPGSTAFAPPGRNKTTPTTVGQNRGNGTSLNRRTSKLRDHARAGSSVKGAGIALRRLRDAKRTGRAFPAPLWRGFAEWDFRMLVPDRVGGGGLG